MLFYKLINLTIGLCLINGISSESSSLSAVSDKKSAIQSCNLRPQLQQVTNSFVNKNLGPRLEAFLNPFEKQLKLLQNLPKGVSHLLLPRMQPLMLRINQTVKRITANSVETDLSPKVSVVLNKFARQCPLHCSNGRGLNHSSCETFDHLKIANEFTHTVNQSLFINDSASSLLQRFVSSRKQSSFSNRHMKGLFNSLRQKIQERATQKMMKKVMEQMTACCLKNESKTTLKPPTFTLETITTVSSTTISSTTELPMNMSNCNVKEEISQTVQKFANTTMQKVIEPAVIEYRQSLQEMFNKTEDIQEQLNNYTESNSVLQKQIQRQTKQNIEDKLLPEIRQHFQLAIHKCRSCVAFNESEFQQKIQSDYSIIFDQLADYNEVLGQKLASAGSNNVITQSYVAFQSIYSQSVAQFLSEQTQEYVDNFLAQSEKTCSSKVTLIRSSNSEISSDSTVSTESYYSKKIPLFVNTDGVGSFFNISPLDTSLPDSNFLNSDKFARLSKESQPNSLESFLQDSFSASNESSPISDQFFQFFNSLNSASSSLITSPLNQNVLNQSEFDSKINLNIFSKFLNSSSQGLKSIPSVFDFFNP